MWQRTRALAGFVFSRGIALIVIIAPFAGCGPSSDVNEIPEESKKAIIQRKVDVTPGTARSSRTGTAPAKGRPAGR
jgi:hypothetical protein